MKLIVFDIDGTILNIDHRLKYITGDGDIKKKDYDSFYHYQNLIQDTATPVLQLLELVMLGARFRDDTKVVFITGRPEKCRQGTIDWLKMNLSIKDEIPEIYMRRDGDHRTDDKVKAEIIDALEWGGDEIILAIDDRTRVCDMYKHRGITILKHLTDCNDY